MPLLLSDHYYRLEPAFTSSATTHEADAQGKVVKRSGVDREVSEVMQVSASTRITSEWQLGGTLSYLKRTREASGLRESTQGMRDFSMLLARELFTEKVNLEVSPRYYFGIEATKAIGKSIYESQMMLNTDVFTSGTDQLGISALVMFPLRRGGVNITQKVTTGFEKKVGEVDYRPPFIISTGVTFHYPLWSEWLTGTASVSREELLGEKVNGTDKPLQRTITIGTSLGYLWNEYTFTLSYSNQHLTPFNKNSGLKSALGISLGVLFE